MSYFQTQCPQCGAIFMARMVGSTPMGGQHLRGDDSGGVPCERFSSAVCIRGTKSCVIEHEEESHA